MIRLHAPDFRTIPVILCSPASWAAELALAYTGMNYEKLVHSEKIVAKLADDEPDFHAPVSLPALEYRPVDKHREVQPNEKPIVIYHPLGILQFIQDLPSAGLQVAPASAFRRELAQQFDAYSLLEKASKLFARCQQAAFLSGVDDKLIRELENRLLYWDSLAQNWTYKSLSCSQILVFVIAVTARYLGYNLPKSYPALGNWCMEVSKIIAVRHAWPSTWPAYEEFDDLATHILSVSEQSPA